MNLIQDGAIVCTGGAIKRSGGFDDAKYSIDYKNVFEDASQGVMKKYKGRTFGELGNCGCYLFHEKSFMYEENPYGLLYFLLVGFFIHTETGIFGSKGSSYITNTFYMQAI